MTYKDSKSVFSATEFRKLILAMIRDDDRIYFKVVSSDQSEVIWGVRSPKSEDEFL